LWRRPARPRRGAFGRSERTLSGDLARATVQAGVATGSGGKGEPGREEKTNERPSRRLKEAMGLGGTMDDGEHSEERQPNAEPCEYLLDDALREAAARALSRFLNNL